MHAGRSIACYLIFGSPQALVVFCFFENMDNGDMNTVSTLCEHMLTDGEVAAPQTQLLRIFFLGSLRKSAS